MWGEVGFIYVFIPICLLPDKFLLKSIRLRFISKEISQAVHNYMNIHIHRAVIKGSKVNEYAVNIAVLQASSAP